MTVANDPEFEALVRSTIDKSIAVGRALQLRETPISQATFDAACNRIAKLEAVLREIVHEYDNTYDASIEPADSRWTAAASIPVEVMERAKALLR
jgi:hypothetical protein